MEPRKMAKQMMDFYKTTFDNTFNALMMVQEQTERMAGLFMGQMLALPEEGKKAYAEWLKAYKKGCEEYKKTVDETFKKMEAFVAEADITPKVKAA